MTDILTRLRDATEGSRELDALIAAVTISHNTTFEDQTEFAKQFSGEDGAVGCSLSIPHYTTSIDAALTLLPETACNEELFSFIGSDHPEFGGKAWALRFSDRAQLVGAKAAHEEIERLRRAPPSLALKISGEPRVILERAIAENYCEFYCEIAATPALALCIAALKARMAKDTAP